MHYKFNRRFNLLNVSDDFASLKKIHANGDIEFEFTYVVSQQKVVSNESLTVNVSIVTRTLKQKALLENSQVGKIDSKKLISNILQQMPNAKSVIKQRDEYSVAVKSSDISAHINNEIFGQLKAKVPTSNIYQLNKPSLKLVFASEINEAADAKPILGRIAYTAIENVGTPTSSSVSESPSRLMHDMIVRQGIDPSRVLEMTHRSTPATDAVDGTLKKQKSQERDGDPSGRLLNQYLFPPEGNSRPGSSSGVADSTLVQVFVNEVDPNVEVPVRVIIPRHAMKSDKNREGMHLFVKFDLINSKTHAAVDTVSKTLDVSRHLQMYYTPKVPPIVKFARSVQSSRANLEIKQIDPGAHAVQVYKKTLHRSTPEIEDYSLIGTYDVKSNQQSLLVPVTLPRDSVTLYRVVPLGRQGTQGFEYTNVVIKPERFKQIKSLSMAVQPIENGIRIEARNIPTHVVAIEFKVRNRSIHEKEFRNVNGNVSLIDDSLRSANYTTIVDRNVFPGNVYEYVARLIYSSGLSDIVGHSLIEFIQPAPGKVDTRISNVQVSMSTSPNVTFDINTRIINTDLDVVKNLLQQQDVYDLFKNDVFKEREFLKNLIAHNVQRVNLTTGLREDFGVVTTLNFNDTELSKNYAIEPLKPGQKYRYEVTALLRSPETLLESLVKDRVDPVTKKPYSYLPAKFLHPIVLKDGTLVSSTGLKTNYSKDPMAHGAIGATQSTEVSLNIEPAYVVDATASRFDRSLNVLTWRLEGAIDQVDHFMIIKDVLGVRTLIGKAHSEFPLGNCQYLHKVSNRDEGSLVYVIVPVFNDYKVGAEVVSNSIVVDKQPKRMLRV